MRPDCRTVEVVTIRGVDGKAVAVDAHHGHQLGQSPLSVRSAAKQVNRTLESPWRDEGSTISTGHTETQQELSWDGGVQHRNQSAIFWNYDHMCAVKGEHIGFIKD